MNEEVLPRIAVHGLSYMIATHRAGWVKRVNWMGMQPDLHIRYVVTVSETRSNCFFSFSSRGVRYRPLLPARTLSSAWGDCRLLRMKLLFPNLVAKTSFFFSHQILFPCRMLTANQ